MSPRHVARPGMGQPRRTGHASRISHSDRTAGGSRGRPRVKCQWGQPQPHVLVRPRALKCQWEYAGGTARGHAVKNRPPAKRRSRRSFVGHVGIPRPISAPQWGIMRYRPHLLQRARRAPALPVRCFSPRQFPPRQTSPAPQLHSAPLGYRETPPLRSSPTPGRAGPVRKTTVSPPWSRDHERAGLRKEIAALFLLDHAVSQALLRVCRGNRADAV